MILDFYKWITIIIPDVNNSVQTRNTLSIISSFKQELCLYQYTANTLFYLLSDYINKKELLSKSFYISEFQLTRKFRRCYYFQVKWVSFSQWFISDDLQRFFSVLVGSSLGLPALQRTGRQYYQQPAYQYYQQQTTFNQYPNVQINGNFNDDICGAMNKGFDLGSLLEIGKIRVLNDS